MLAESFREVFREKDLLANKKYAIHFQLIVGTLKSEMIQINMLFLQEQYFLI